MCAPQACPFQGQVISSSEKATSLQITAESVHELFHIMNPQFQ